jgi:hypothetical protein
MRGLHQQHDHGGNYDICPRDDERSDHHCQFERDDDQLGRACRHAGARLSPLEPGVSKQRRDPDPLHV